MAGEQVKISNITLITPGRVPSIAEVKCPTCDFTNSFKVKGYWGPTGSETEKCCECGAKIAFKWEKANY